MRYAVFTFDDYYPSGGMGDCAALFVATDDAAAKAHVESLLPDIMLDSDSRFPLGQLELYELGDTEHRFIGRREGTWRSVLDERERILVSVSDWLPNWRPA